MPERGVSFDLHFEDSTGVLEPVDDILSEMHWVLDLDEGAKFRLIVLKVEASISHVSLNKGVDSTYTDVLDPEVIVRTSSNLNVIPVNRTSRRVVEVNYVQIFLPGCCWDLSLRVHIAILKEGLQDDIVALRLADFVELDWLALVKRIRNTVLVLAFTDLTVERLPWVSYNLFIASDSHDVSSWKPSFEAEKVDYRLGPSALARAY